MTDNSPQKFVQRKDDHRLQTYSPKASGDSSDLEKKARSKSKNRIPKRLRYELENALVGLCDIWFEEIKPYLVRNKIKLHVHDDMGGGSGDRGEVPSTFKCSHLDPGRSDRHRYTNANFVSCCSTQPTVLKAPCRKQPPTQLPQKDAQTQNHSTNCKKERARKPRKRRKFQQTQSRQPVPRLCRTYSIPPLTTPTETIANTLQQISHNYKDLNLNRKPQMKNVYSTLTDYFSENIKITKRYSCNAKSPSPKLFRSDATAALSPSKQNVHKKDIPLLQNDLIDNWQSAKIQEKEMEELLTSPRKDEFPSIMNLYVASKIKPNTKEFSKIRPWR